MAKVYLKGLPSLKRKLIRLKEDTMPTVRPAMEQAAEMIAATMRTLVPVEDGDLRKAIGWTWGDAPKGSISFSHTVAGNKITIFAGNDDAFYARFVEFGTAPHAIMSGGKTRFAKKGGSRVVQHPGGRARPFFYPAYRMHKKQVKTMIAQQIRIAVQKAVR